MRWYKEMCAKDLVDSYIDIARCHIRLWCVHELLIHRSLPCLSLIQVGLLEGCWLSLSSSTRCQMSFLCYLMRKYSRWWLFSRWSSFGIKAVVEKPSWFDIVVAGISGLVGIHLLNLHPVVKMCMNIIFICYVLMSPARMIGLNSLNRTLTVLFPMLLISLLFFWTFPSPEHGWRSVVILSKNLRILKLYVRL